jgi:hypothetical protein
VDQAVKSYISIYWVCYIVYTVASNALCWCFVFFQEGICFLLLVFIPIAYSATVGMIENGRLLRYLDSNYRHLYRKFDLLLWRHKFISIIFSPEEYNDPKLAFLKSNSRKIMCLSYIAMAAGFLSFGMLHAVLSGL